MKSDKLPRWHKDWLTITNVLSEIMLNHLLINQIEYT